MKGFKKFLVVIICFIFVGSVILNYNSANAAATKISPTIMNLTINQTKQINITNKNSQAVYSFKSSNTKIVTVNKSGVVKAIKKGTASITVNSLYKKKISKLGTVKVTVKAAIVPTPTVAPTPTIIPNYTKVACVGDSITVGMGSTNNSYTMQLKGMLGSEYQIRNFGKSGTSMLKKADSPYWNTLAFKNCTNWLPDIVIIMLGTNDSNARNWIYKDEFLNDYKEMINLFKNLDSHPTVYVATCATVYNGGAWGITDEVVTGEVVPLIIQAAKDTDCKVIDVNTATKGMPENFPDNVHGNKEGYKAIATAVYKAITADSSETILEQ